MERLNKEWILATFLYLKRFASRIICIEELSVLRSMQVQKMLTYFYGAYVYNNLLYLYRSGKVEWTVVGALTGTQQK